MYRTRKPSRSRTKDRQLIERWQSFVRDLEAETCNGILDNGLSAANVTEVIDAFLEYLHFPQAAISLAQYLAGQERHNNVMAAKE